MLTLIVLIERGEFSCEEMNGMYIHRKILHGKYFDRNLHIYGIAFMCASINASKVRCII